jgi:hypothetical protein
MKSAVQNDNTDSNNSSESCKLVRHNNTNWSGMKNNTLNELLYIVGCIDIGLIATVIHKW